MVLLNPVETRVYGNNVKWFSRVQVLTRKPLPYQRMKFQPRKKLMVESRLYLPVVDKVWVGIYHFRWRNNTYWLPYKSRTENIRSIRWNHWVQNWKRQRGPKSAIDLLKRGKEEGTSIQAKYTMRTTFIVCRLWLSQKFSVLKTGRGGGTSSGLCGAKLSDGWLIFSAIP
jgi:hypothetical protein